MNVECPKCRIMIPITMTRQGKYKLVCPDCECVATAYSIAGLTRKRKYWETLRALDQAMIESGRMGQPGYDQFTSGRIQGLQIARGVVEMLERCQT